MEPPSPFGASPILVSPALGIRYGAGEWTDPFYFTLPRERTRPLREDVRGFPRFCLGTSRQVEY